MSRLSQDKNLYIYITEYIWYNSSIPFDLNLTNKSNNCNPSTIYRCSKSTVHYPSTRLLTQVLQIEFLLLKVYSIIYMQNQKYPKYKYP